MRLTFKDVFMISAVTMIWTSNDIFMSDARWAHIPWYFRWGFGLIHWAIMMGIAAGLWRLMMGKGRWS